MEIITIASLDPKEKLTFVSTTDGRKLRVWNDKAERLGLEQGGTYEVETEGSQYGTHITKAKRIAAPPAVAKSPVQPAAAPFRTPEQMFAQGIIEAYIGNGRCPPEKLTETIGYVLKAFNHHWPSDYLQAAE